MSICEVDPSVKHVVVPQNKGTPIYDNPYYRGLPKKVPLLRGIVNPNGGSVVTEHVLQDGFGILDA